MSAYLAYIKIAFQRNTVYKMDYLLGILNTCLQIFIYCAIWKVLYGTNAEVNGITYAMVTTNFIIGQGLSNAYNINDTAIQTLLRDGSIANNLLKPVNFRGWLLADNFGNILFRLITNFIPSVLIATFIIGLLPPASISAVIYFIMSIVFGFFVFWVISSIVQMSAFWIMNVWSISTIKNVIVNILAGASLPLWFMPESILKIIHYTPFDSIYFVPVQIYMGQITGEKIWYCFIRQILWFVFLFAISSVLWECGKRKIISQGG